MGIPKDRWNEYQKAYREKKRKEERSIKISQEEFLKKWEAIDHCLNAPQGMYK